MRPSKVFFFFSPFPLTSYLPGTYSLPLGFMLPSVMHFTRQKERHWQRDPNRWEWNRRCVCGVHWVSVLGTGRFQESKLQCFFFFFFFDVRILLLNVTMLYFILMINLLIVPFEVIIVVVHRFKTKGYELA